MSSLWRKLRSRAPRRARDEEQLVVPATVERVERGAIAGAQPRQDLARRARIGLLDRRKRPVARHAFGSDAAGC